MKTEKNILIAFILNLAFSVIETAGGIFTGSVAILSDALHDLGDAISIGIAFFLEKKSKKKPDKNYTYGYLRYSVLGSVITCLILLIGSLAVVYGAINRIITPTEINYDGMILLAVVGALVNFLAAFFTHEGDSLNQKAVNLHMLEDMLGWTVVLVGAIVMRFTDLAVIDPLMSIGVAVFIIVNAVKNLNMAISVFLEKTPHTIDVSEIREHILGIDGVKDVHHIHIWSIDGEHSYATMHIVSDEDHHKIKEKVREELHSHDICHATLELETVGEHCPDEVCSTEFAQGAHHHHHH